MPGGRLGLTHSGVDRFAHTWNCQRANLGHGLYGVHDEFAADLRDNFSVGAANLQLGVGTFAMIGNASMKISAISSMKGSLQEQFPAETMRGLPGPGCSMVEPLPVLNH